MSSGNDMHAATGEDRSPTRPPIPPLAATGLSRAVAVAVVLAELCRAGAVFAQMSSPVDPAYLAIAWLPATLGRIAVAVTAVVLLLRPGRARLGWGALATAVVTDLATYQLPWLLLLPFDSSGTFGVWMLPAALSLILYVVALVALLHPSLRESVLHDAGRWSREAVAGGLAWVTAHALLETLAHTSPQAGAVVPASLLHALAALLAGFAFLIHRRGRGGPWQITAALVALATILPLLWPFLVVQQLGTLLNLGPTILGGLLAAAWTTLLVSRSAGAPAAAPHHTPPPTPDDRSQRRLLRLAATVLVLARTPAMIKIMMMAMAIGGGGAIVVVLMFLPTAVVLIIIAIAWRAQLALGWGAVMTHATAGLIQWGTLAAITLTARAVDPRSVKPSNHDGIFVIGLVIAAAAVTLLCCTRVVQAVRDGGATARTKMLQGAAVTTLLHGLITLMLGGRTGPGKITGIGLLGALACLTIAGAIYYMPRPVPALALAVAGVGVAAVAGQLDIAGGGAAVASTFGVIPPGWSFIVITGLAGWSWRRDATEHPAPPRAPEGAPDQTSSATARTTLPRA